MTVVGRNHTRLMYVHDGHQHCHHLQSAAAALSAILSVDVVDVVRSGCV